MIPIYSHQHGRVFFDPANSWILISPTAPKWLVIPKPPLNRLQDEVTWGQISTSVERKDTTKIDDGQCMYIIVLYCILYIVYYISYIIYYILYIIYHISYIIYYISYIIYHILYTIYHISYIIYYILFIIYIMLYYIIVYYIIVYYSIL